MKNLGRIFLILISVFLCTDVLMSQTISLSPDNGDPGTSFSVTITGMGFSFVGSSTVQCVEVSNGTTTFTFGASGAASPTMTITGTMSVPITAEAGSDYDVTVYNTTNNSCTGSSTVSCSDCFTVNNAVPLITASSPSMGDRGDSFGVTLTGGNTNWSGTHCIEISNGSTTLSLLGTANSSTELVGTLDIPLNAVVGADYDIMVYADMTGDCSGNTDGTCTDCFAVTEPTPVGNISPNPNTQRAGETFGVSLTGIGTSWASLTSHCVEIFDDAENVVIQFTTNVASEDFNFMSGSLSIPFATSPGFYNMRVYDQDDGMCTGDLDGSCTDCFFIDEPFPPSITSVSPSTGTRDTVRDLCFLWRVSKNETRGVIATTQ